MKKKTKEEILIIMGVATICAMTGFGVFAYSHVYSGFSWGWSNILANMVAALLGMGFFDLIIHYKKDRQHPKDAVKE